jgi:hypothetical protein
VVDSLDVCDGVLVEGRNRHNMVSSIVIHPLGDPDSTPSVEVGVEVVERPLPRLLFEDVPHFRSDLLVLVPRAKRGASVS